MLCASTYANANAGLKMRHSTNFGISWSDWITVLNNSTTKSWRSYSINDLVTNVELGSLTTSTAGAYTNIFAFYMGTMASNHLRHRKFSGGVQYKLNFDTTVWEPAYRIPLAQFEISLNEDGTGPAFEHPNYTWVPQMGLEPALRRIIS